MKVRASKPYGRVMGGRFSGKSTVKSPNLGESIGDKWTFYGGFAISKSTNSRFCVLWEKNSNLLGGDWNHGIYNDFPYIGNDHPN